MSLLEYHVLLALASAPLHGYAIKDVVAVESDGTLTPRAGSLYRVIARLMTIGYVKDTEPRIRRRIQGWRGSTTRSPRWAGRRSPQRRDA
jgi:DNA-binding PadR family transcriptional regulator